MKQKVLTEQSNIDRVDCKGIAREFINKLPLYRYEGTIKVIFSKADVAHAIKDLERESILGFDTESQPSFRRGVTYPPALVQLAGQETVYIFQLHLMEDMKAFAPLFENSKVIKAGVGINDDLLRLKKVASFNESGFSEITKMADQLVILNKGLRGLAAYLLGVRISKNMQLSNWSQKALTHAQIVYAATDAWISRKIYMRLIEEPTVDSGLNM